MEKNTKHFEDLLLKEKTLLEKELSTVGRKNPKDSDWEAIEGDVVTDTAEEGDVAEGIEEYEKNSAVLSQLELRLKEVKEALDKIKMGNYGKCEVDGNPIEDDRLEANPAAKTCKAHMNG